jgi:hypothetical protein
MLDVFGSWYLIIILSQMSGSNAATLTSFTVPMYSERACMVSAKFYKKQFEHDAIISCLNTASGNVGEIK